MNKAEETNEITENELLKVRKQVLRNLTREELSAVNGGDSPVTGEDTTTTPVPGRG
jgi:hypothetical protein